MSDINPILQKRLHEHMANKKKGGRSGNGAAGRASRRNQESAIKQAERHQSVSDTDKATLIKQLQQAEQLRGSEPVLRITPLGGQDEVGSKNMTIIEYGQDAIVIDAGFNLSVDLPGINYAIPDITYLESIKHKVRGYIFTHGHLDHIGATPYIIPKVPAPVYGSRFTIGMVEKQLADSDMGTDYKIQAMPMNIDSNERLKVGPFMVEMLRVTHSIPDSCAVVIDTPAGRIVHTGDFRLDPEPLDQRPTDIGRLEELGQQGVLLLLSESTNTESPGRTPTEHTLEQSFHDILAQSPGRVLVATFSSNINRIQMIINGAVASGRRVLIDGRSMLSNVELAVKLGYMKIPKGTIAAMNSINTMKDREIVVLCTGGQGEPNAALSRMASGDHHHLKLKTTDTVVISSTAIPGNEVPFMQNVNDLMLRGATVFRHRTHELDGCGPLHVSGHANRDEHKQMLQMVKPKYVMPNHGPFAHRQRYLKIAEEAGMDPKQVVLIENGEVLEFKAETLQKNGKVPTGSILIDQTGAVVPGLVIKDRLLMSEDGIVVVVLTLDRTSGQFLSSPDIISRGFIYMRDNEELMNDLRNQLRQFSARRGGKVDINRLKQELRDEVNHFLFKATNRSPIIIPVINTIGGGKAKKPPVMSGLKVNDNPQA